MRIVNFICIFRNDSFKIAVIYIFLSLLTLTIKEVFHSIFSVFRRKNLYEANVVETSDRWFVLLEFRFVLIALVWDLSWSRSLNYEHKTMHIYLEWPYSKLIILEHELTSVKKDCWQLSRSDVQKECLPPLEMFINSCEIWSLSQFRFVTSLRLLSATTMLWKIIEKISYRLFERRKTGW